MRVALAEQDRYGGTCVIGGFDDDARGLVAEEMRRAGIDLQTGTEVLSLENAQDGGRVKASNGEQRVFEHVLFAIGRRSNTRDRGLASVGVKLGRAGKVVVDAYSQTSVFSIHAVGDVTDRLNLTPMAIRERMAFVETVFKGKPTQPDYEAVPTATSPSPRSARWA